jgi:serine/threonine-protein kinase
LTASGEVKVLDFGIAAAGDTAITTGDLLGTAAYLAPERVLGHRATPAADIYALGVVLYELLAGHRPFTGDSDVELAMAHVNATPPPLTESAPATPPSLIAACHQALAKDPASRPSSAAEFARLVRASDAEQSTTHPLPIASPTSRRRGLLVAVLLAGALVAALPTLAGGLPGLVRERVQGPIAVLDQGGTTPNAETPGSGSGGTNTAPDPDPPSSVDPGAGDPRADEDGQRGDDDRGRDEDSSGSGGGSGGGSSGPG